MIGAYDLQRAVETLARAIEQYANAQITAAKIAANSEQRAAGNSPLYSEVER